jgi:hypothetical protein
VVTSSGEGAPPTLINTGNKPRPVLSAYCRRCRSDFSFAASSAPFLRIAQTLASATTDDGCLAGTDGANGPPAVSVPLDKPSLKGLGVSIQFSEAAEGRKHQWGRGVLGKMQTTVGS